MRWAFALVLLIVFSVPANASEASDPVLIYALSVVSQGNRARVQAALDKARAGKSLTVVGLAGSITAGTGASSPSQAWFSLVGSWLRCPPGRYTVSLTTTNAAGSTTVTKARCVAVLRKAASAKGTVTPLSHLSLAAGFAAEWLSPLRVPPSNLHLVFPPKQAAGRGLSPRPGRS